MLSDVPSEEPPHYTEWWLSMQRWLAELGLQFIEIQLEHTPWMPLPEATLAIFLGPHKTGCMHAIVGRCIDQKMEPVFDPMGEEELPFEKVEAVCLLVPVDPMLVVKPQRALSDIIKTCSAIPNKIVAESIQSTARSALGQHTLTLILP